MTFDQILLYGSLLERVKTSTPGEIREIHDLLDGLIIEAIGENVEDGVRDLQLIAMRLWL